MVNQEIMEHLIKHMGQICTIQHEKIVEVGTPVLFREIISDKDLEGKIGDVILIFVSWATPKAEGLKRINLTTHDIKIEKILNRQ